YMLGTVFIQVHRVQAESGVHVVFALHQIPHPLPVGLLHAQHHQPLHAQGAAAGQHFAAVAIEVGEVEVGVGIDQVHCSSIDDLLGTGQRPVGVLDNRGQ